MKRHVTRLNTLFKDLYQTLPEKAFFAPGRINLIGEDTDYNGGHFFPCAIIYGKSLLPSLSTVKVYTELMGETAVDPLLERNEGRTVSKKI